MCIDERAQRLAEMMMQRREADLRNEGKAEGKAEGIEEGRADATTNIMRALYTSGMKEEEIAFRLNMPLSLIQSLVRAS